VHTLLHIAGLVDHQDRTRIAERVDDVVAQICASPSPACGTGWRRRRSTKMAATPS
jgi:hypothetical protein